MSELVAFIDPTKIGNRTKLPAQRMIRAGVFARGYASNTRALARALIDTHLKVPAPTRSGSRYNNLHMLPPEAKHKLLELADLAVTLAKMNDDVGGYFILDAKEEQQSLKLALDGKQADAYYPHGTAVIYYHSPIVREAVTPQFDEVFDKCKTPEHLAALDAVASMLDQPNPIRIYAPV